jgi:regulator of protease activity HflC (stomatin/prohibitin superfamily)
VERVEIKDVSLPESMKRSMSRQAEAERERRARIITATRTGSKPNARSRRLQGSARPRAVRQKGIG